MKSTQVTSYIPTGVSAGDPGRGLLAQGRCGTRNKYTGEKQQEEYAGRGNSLCKIPEAKWSVREDSLEKKVPSQSLKGGPGERAFQPEGSKWAKAQVCETPQVSVLRVPVCEDSGGGGGAGRGQKGHAAEGWQASGEGGLAGSGRGECGERSSRVPLAGQREARGEDTGEVLAVVSRPSPALAAGGAQTPLKPHSRSSPLSQVCAGSRAHRRVLSSETGTVVRSRRQRVTLVLPVGLERTGGGPNFYVLSAALLQCLLCAGVWAKVVSQLEVALNLQFEGRLIHTQARTVLFRKGYDEGTVLRGAAWK